MTVEKLIENSPILVNRDKWNRIKGETNSQSNGDKVQLHAIHLYYKTLNNIEYSLLTEEAKDCCYDLGNDLREFDGYYVFVGDLSNVSDYWKEKLNNPSISETIEVPENIFEDDYFERYTRQLKKLDITYVINHYKLVHNQYSCIGVPVVSTIEEIIEDVYGIKDDKDLVAFNKEKMQELYDDPLWTIPSFTCSDVKICLQDIVCHECKIHDKGEYQFTYTCHGIKIHSLLTIVSDTICTVRFYTDSYIEDKDHYMYLNHSLEDNVVKKIYDNSEYWTTKIAEDFI